MSDNINFTNDEGSAIKEHERLLPIANVGRIMKHILPQDAKISKEAKETMQECVSEFISFVTGEASEKCRKERRKTVNGDDICWALGTLGFDDYAAPLKRYLDRYREVEVSKSNNQERVNNGEEREVHPPLYRDQDEDPSVAKLNEIERINCSTSCPSQN